jgi:hypothetical protein
MSCSEVRPLLALRTLHALETSEESLVGAHVGKCDLCRAESAELDAAFALLGEAPPAASPPHPEAREDVWEKLERELVWDGAPAPGVKIAIACCYCHATLERAAACYCASCLAPHHDECWRAHGHCAAPGCDETQSVRPRGVEEPRAVATPRRGPSRLVFGIAVLALGGYTVAAATLSGGTRAKSRDVAPPQDATDVEEPGAREMVDVDVHDADLSLVLEDVARRCRHSIVVTDGIHEKVTLSLKKAPWRDAVYELADPNRFEVRPISAETLLVEPRRLVTIHEAQTSLGAALRSLAIQARKSIVVGSSAGTTTRPVDLESVPWLDALKTVLATFGAHAVAKGGVVAVLPGPGLDLPENATIAVPEGLFPNESSLPRARRVDISAKETSLLEVCNMLSPQIGVAIFPGADMDQEITLKLERTPWQDALLALSHIANRSIERRGTSFILVAPPSLALDGTDVPAAEWFRLLAANARAKTAASSDATGTVTGHIEQARYQEAVEASGLVLEVPDAPDVKDMVAHQCVLALLELKDVKGDARTMTLVTPEVFETRRQAAAKRLLEGSRAAADMGEAKLSEKLKAASDSVLDPKTTCEAAVERIDEVLAALDKP